MRTHLDIYTIISEHLFSFTKCLLSGGILPPHGSRVDVALRFCCVICVWYVMFVSPCLSAPREHLEVLVYRYGDALHAALGCV